jgi:hypothetical protein
MKKVDRSKLPEDDLRRYDWSRAVRGKHADKAAALGRLVRMLDPEIAELFPDSRSVNDALRAVVALNRAFPKRKINSAA